MFVVSIPRRRAYMHLDTVFTPIDRDDIHLICWMAIEAEAADA